MLLDILSLYFRASDGSGIDAVDFLMFKYVYGRINNQFINSI